VERAKLKIERGTAESGAFGIAVGDSDPRRADAPDRLDHREGLAKLSGGDDMI
jgi:hypothetical protein